MSDEYPARYDEFAFLEQYAEHEGIPWTGRPPLDRRSVSLRGGEPGQAVSALVWGDGEPEIVLLHGGGQNAHTWDSVALALGGSLVAFDLPGHGHSSWRADTDYRPGPNAAAIAEAMAVLAPHAGLVVGMSLGGATAISLAAAYPHLVARLVVVDVTPGTATRHAAMTAEQRGAVALVDGPPVFDTFDDMLQATVAAAPGRAIETLRPGVRHNSRQREDGRWVWRYDRVRRPAGADDVDPWDALSATTAPIMLVIGGDSPFVHDDDRAEFVRRRPGTRVEVVAGAHHSIQSDRPVRLAALISNFAAA